MAVNALLRSSTLVSSHPLPAKQLILVFSLTGNPTFLRFLRFQSTSHRHKLLGKQAMKYFHSSNLSHTLFPKVAESAKVSQRARNLTCRVHARIRSAEITEVLYHIDTELPESLSGEFQQRTKGIILHVI